MSRKKDKAQMKQLKKDLKAAEQNYVSGVRTSNYRLLKLALLMVILAIVVAFAYGRIQI